MMTFLIFGLLVAAGAAIVVQNLLMAHMTKAVSTVLITLVMNSAVNPGRIKLFRLSGKRGCAQVQGWLSESL
ncbi:hypothetical protein [Azospirillum brasilense]|uniref:hypothetical protein n=1 Tax=Azospirillum brasilense TaxID=192 RepID=UPI00157BB3F5|nr:hypothetical protein [Azospirillum brasilense]